MIAFKDFRNAIANAIAPIHNEAAELARQLDEADRMMAPLVSAYGLVAETEDRDINDAGIIEFSYDWDIGVDGIVEFIYGVCNAWNYDSRIAGTPRDDNGQLMSADDLVDEVLDALSEINA